MASKTYVLNLGVDYEELTDLRAQKRDSSGAIDGAAIASGFTEVGSGVYEFTTTIADDYQGSISFYSDADPTYIFMGFAINGGSQTLPDASGNPSSVVAYLYYYIDDVPTEGATLYHQQVASTDDTFEDDIQSVQTDANGYAGWDAVLGGTYRYWVNNGRFRTITIDEYTPDPYHLPDVAG